MTKMAVKIIKGQKIELSVGALATTDMQPSTKGEIYDTALPGAESNWFATAITVPADGTMRLAVQVSIIGILRAVINSTTTPITLNGGSSLTASTGYTFDIPVVSGQTINVRYSTTSGTIHWCIVQFVKGGI